MKNFTHIFTVGNKQVEITIKERKSTRSLKANALYWKWLEIMGKDLGYTKDELHFTFKKLFLADKMPALSKDEFTDYLHNLGKELATTRKLNTREFSEYMGKVYEQSRELSIALPTPDFQGLVDES